MWNKKQKSKSKIYKNSWKYLQNSLSGSTPKLFFGLFLINKYDKNSSTCFLLNLY